MKPTAHEITANEKILCYSHFPRAKALPHYAGPHGKSPELIRKQKQWEENMSKSLYCGFRGKRTGEVG